MKNFKIYFLTLFIISVLSLNVFSQEIMKPTKVFQQAGITTEQLSKVDHIIQNFTYNVLTNNVSVLKSIKYGEGTPVVKELNNKLYVAGFVKSSSPQSTKIRIESGGGKVSNIIDNILVVELPIEKLETTLFEKDIIRAEAAVYQSSLLDTSLYFINAHKVHNGEELPRAYKGNGVIVGVLDSGIDWTHPAFINENGNRIQYLWDVSDDSNPPAEFDYGTEYTKSDLDQQNCSQIDDNGHGTHVASTAAGNYGGEEYPLIGVAPDADIVFVKGSRGSAGLMQTDIINGCDYIMKRAEVLNKPVVLNLSLGSVLGNTGYSLYEEALSNLVEPGKLIVASAGNSGSSNIHLQYRMSGNDFESRSNTEWVVSDSTRGIALIYGYPQTADFNIGVQVLDNQGNSKFISATISAEEDVQQAIVIDGDTLATLSLSGLSKDEVDPYFFSVIMFFNSDSDVKKYTYNLFTFGTAIFNAWIANGKFDANTEPERNHFGGDNQMTVGSPSTSFNVFSIGAFTTRTDWVNFSGTSYSVDGTLTDRASFSSIGPTRDGRIKPDFSAPGQLIAAAYSIDAELNPTTVLSDEIVLMQGTSMSAPHFTGVVALLLEQNPNLSYEQVYEVLKNTAIIDEMTGNVPNNEFGYGRVDVHAALQTLITSAEDDNFIPGEFSLSQNYPNPFNPSTTIEYSLPAKEFVKIKVYDVLGNEITTLVNDNKSAGKYRISFDASNLSSGVYFYRVSAGSFQEVRKMILLR